jgi:hypothetical protein
LAAANAEAYPGSGVGVSEEAECRVLAMETVEACNARERAISGKAKCLPDSQRPRPERS